MKSKIVKPVFFIFLFLTFLAGWYFYIINPTAHYIEYMDNMNMQTEITTTDITQNPVDQSNNIVPTPFMVQDANRDDLTYNTNMYAGFDPTSQYVGVYTNLDKIHESTSYSELSDNPMDSNWGGVLYTKDAVDSGKYADNVVMPYGSDPQRGFGISTSINMNNMKSVFA